MHKKLISVIIPIFNAEKYLSCCIESVLSQTYTHFEILLINDGSIDGSEDICIDYQNKDSRIKLINKKNGGVSSARNKGLELATGEFIYFLDADDKIAEQTFEECINLFSERKVDLVSFGYAMKETNNNRVVDSTRKKITNYSNQEYYRFLFNANEYRGFVWEKIFKKEYIDKLHLRFDADLKFHEDCLFTFTYLSNCKSVVLYDYPLYTYMLYETSSMGNFKNSQEFNTEYLKTLPVFDYFRKELEKQNVDNNILEMFAHYYTAWCIRIYDIALNKNYSNKIVFNDLYVRTRKVFSLLTLKLKVKYLLFNINPNIHFRLKRILKLK